jgi:CubicO group peptidase (beta-lactamase class C family)
MANRKPKRRSKPKSLLARTVWLVCVASLSSDLCAAVPQANIQKRPGLDARVDAVIADFRTMVPGLMRQFKVPGVALALVDDQGILWAEGFGVTRPKGKTPVTPDTLFLLEGMSRAITATALMLAVQDGLLDLDQPITNYLPDVRFSSRYEEHPESRITLRHLLNNTAGLPVEAPLGNHFEPSPAVSFEDHVKSVYGTWLVFPAGKGFQISNASCDLAAYILQVRVHKPFEQYMSERVFGPLGMSRTTVDRAVILNATNRAVGSMLGIAKMPAVYPALGAGCVYSTANDLARFVQMHLSQGMPGGKRLLAPSFVRLMHTPVAVVEAPDAFYGVGMNLDKRAPDRVEHLLWQDGWGFGFCGLMHWYPEYGLGAVALSNRLPNPGVADLALTLTDRLIAQKLVPKRFPGYHLETNHCVSAWWGWPDHKPTPYRPEWREYGGTYPLRFGAYELEWWAKLAVLIRGRDEYTPRIQIHQKDGFLCLTESRFFDTIGIPRHVDQRLQEIAPGLFFAASGIALDLRSAEPTWRSYRLTKWHEPKKEDKR